MATPTDSARERARALVDLGRYPEAAAVAREALAATPDDFGSLVLLAVALCESDQAGEALPAAQQAVALRPDSAHAHRTLGWVTYRLGRYDEAAAILAHALTLNPHDAETHVMRGEAMLKLAHRTKFPHRRRSELIDQAERHAAEAVRLEPHAAGGYLIHGKAAASQGQGAIAESWGRKALAVEPDNPVGHQVLGLAAQLRGDTRVAADHYVEAGKLNPRSDSSMKMLRNIRATGPVGGIALYIIVRVAITSGRVGGAAIAAVVATLVIAAALLYRFVWPRWQARRTMSATARQALARDRQLRTTPLKSRLRPPGPR